MDVHGAFIFPKKEYKVMVNKFGSMVKNTRVNGTTIYKMELV